jgi:hypothetical protein
VPPVVILSRAQAQIADVLSYTLEQFGEAKYLEYRELIELALQALSPTASSPPPADACAGCRSTQPTSTYKCDNAPRLSFIWRLLYGGCQAARRGTVDLP